MSRYAHLIDVVRSGDAIVAGRVAEILAAFEGMPIAECYHADVVADLVACTDAVGAGWTYALDASGAPSFSAPVIAPVSEAQLAAFKARAKAAVDAAAERLRLSLITPGSGQAMEYQEAYAEAVQVEAAAKAGQTLDAGNFPMLSASIGHGRDPQTGAASVDLAGEARAVLAAYDAYQQASAAIRATRLKGKAAIDAAATAEAAEAAFAAVVMPALA